MWRGEVITSWTGDGQSEETANRPTFGDAYLSAANWRAGQKWEDVTGQPSANLRPDPNMYVIYFELEPDVLDLLEADNDYQILWSEEIEDAEI